MTTLPAPLAAFLREIGLDRPAPPPAVPAHLLGQSPTVWRPTPGNTEPPF